MKGLVLMDAGTWRRIAIIIMWCYHNKSAVAWVVFHANSIEIISLFRAIVKCAMHSFIGIRCAVDLFLGSLAGWIGCDPVDGDNVDSDINGAACQANNTTFTAVHDGQCKNVGGRHEQAYNRGNKCTTSYIMQSSLLPVAVYTLANLHQGLDKEDSHIQIEDLHCSMVSQKSAVDSISFLRTKS